MKRYRDRYRRVKFSSYIFTKLDETRSLGPILNLCYGHSERLSYISRGQNIPEDIELLQVQRFVDGFFKESEGQ